MRRRSRCSGFPGRSEAASHGGLRVRAALQRCVCTTQPQPCSAVRQRGDAGHEARQGQDHVLADECVHDGLHAVAACLFLQAGPAVAEVVDEAGRRRRRRYGRGEQQEIDRARDRKTPPWAWVLRSRSVAAPVNVLSASTIAQWLLSPDVDQAATIGAVRLTTPPPHGFTGGREGGRDAVPCGGSNSGATGTAPGRGV